MLSIDDLTFDIVTIGDKPWWQFSDGTRLPVVSGGADDGGGGDGDGGDGGGGDGGGTGGDGGSGDDDGAFDADRARAKITKANSEAANLRKRLKELEPLAARAKELEPLAARAKELEDAGKSEAQKLTEEATGHKSRADQAELTVLRYKVALRKGLTETQAKRLVGATEEELEADADDLISSFGGGGGDGGGQGDKTRRPKERLRPGAVPDAKPEETDPRKLAALVPRS